MSSQHRPDLVENILKAQKASEEAKAEFLTNLVASGVPITVNEALVFILGHPPLPPDDPRGSMQMAQADYD